VDYSQLITIEPGKRGGQPCVRGMRITVRDVLEYLAGGMTVDELLADFPELTIEDIRACLAFAANPIPRPREPAVRSESVEKVAIPPTLQELGVDRLSPEDRLALAEAIWDSVARDAETAALPPAQRAELERRLADSIAHPDAVTPWEVIKARALARART
jgi:putative addiction module component (TIGR02574 family)